MNPSSPGVFRRLLSALAVFLFTASVVSAVTSAWVYYDVNGNLQYQSDAQGNRIMDYSWAGYGAGGVVLPQVTVQATVTPSGGDDTAAIQAAINQVAALTPVGGFRGAVRLAPGNFTVSSTLNIATGGVVLSGSGSGDGGTVVTMTGGGFLFLNIASSGTYATSGSATLTDSYIPSGTSSFNVSSTAGFSVGDLILIQRPVTTAWVHFMNMDTLGAGKTWLTTSTKIKTERKIAAISGSLVTIDVPLTDSFDSAYSITGTMVHYTWGGRVSQVGVEHLKLIGAPTEQTGTNPMYNAVEMTGIFDGWIRNLALQDTENSISVDATSKRVTVENVRVVHTYAQTNIGAPGDFSLSGTQVLAVNCFVTGLGNTWPFTAQGPSTGPTVLLDCFADDRGFDPHQRWSTGLLADLCNFPSTHVSDKASIGYSNRGTAGSGHGWDAGWSVAWNVNVTTGTLVVQAPPGVNNWAIGCIGTKLTQGAPGSTGTLLPNGIYESLGTPVTPGSLYLAQLKQRLGASALTNIGYADVNGTQLPVAAPTFTPAAGTYASAQTVTIASATPGAAIRYTTNGSTPTATSGTLYTGAVTVAATQTLKAIAYEGGLADSSVSTAAYTINPPAAPSSLVATASSGQKVNLSWADNATTETAFKVKRATVSGGPYTQVGSDLAANSTSYLDATVVPGTAYYYVVTCANAAGESSNSNEAQVTVPLATVMEAEDLPVAAISSGDTHQIVADAGASAGNYHLLYATATADFISYTVTVNATGIYNIKTRVTKKTDRGVYQLKIDGTNQGTAQDYYTNSTPPVYSELDLGYVSLSAGDHTFRLECTGKNASATAYKEGLDTIKLTKVLLLEAESLSVAGISSGDTHQTVADAGASGGNYHLLVDNAAADFISYTVTVPATGTYNVKTRVTKKTDRGIYQLKIDGTNQGAAQDYYTSSTPPVYVEIDLGNVSLSAGAHTFRLECTGKNASASAYKEGLDYISLCLQ